MHANVCLLQVWPNTHKLKGNNYYFSSLPGRFKLWQDLRVKGHSHAPTHHQPCMAGSIQVGAGLASAQSVMTASILSGAECHNLQERTLEVVRSRLLMPLECANG